MDSVDKLREVVEKILDDLGKVSPAIDGLDVGDIKELLHFLTSAVGRENYHKVRMLAEHVANSRCACGYTHEPDTDHIASTIYRISIGEDIAPYIYDIILPHWKTFDHAAVLALPTIPRRKTS